MTDDNHQVFPERLVSHGTTDVLWMLEELKNYEWLEQCTVKAMESQSVLQLMENVRALFLERFDFDRFGILLGAFNDRYCVIHELVTRDGVEPIPVGSLMIVKNTGLEWVYRHQLLHYNPDLMSHPEFVEDEEMVRLGLRSMVRIPLVFQKSVFGVMTLKISHADFYSPADLRLMEKVALRLSAFLHSAKLVYELRQQAYTDALTGTLNRRFLSELEEVSKSSGGSGVLDYLEQHAGFSFEESEAVSVLFVDIDSFKSMNDEYGHAMGDKYLFEVAKLLLGSVDKKGFVVRYGGDEFIVVLPGVPLHEAEQHAQLLRQRMKAGEFVVDLRASSITFDTTLSIGCASGQWSELSDILKRSDEAMYARKQGAETLELLRGESTGRLM